MEIVSLDVEMINYPTTYTKKKLSKNNQTYKNIKRSIKEYGFVEPLVVNSDGYTLIDGYQRLEALKELGYKAVDVVLVTLDKDKELELAIALNKVKGDWDINKLKSVLDELDGIFTGVGESFMAEDFSLIDELMEDEPDQDIDGSDIDPNDREKQTATKVDKTTYTQITFAFHREQDKAVLDRFNHEGVLWIKDKLVDRCRRVYESQKI